MTHRKTGLDVAQLRQAALTSSRVGGQGSSTPRTEPDFDVIVVGAGIAGSLTSYILAQRGHQVVMIERGEAPGSKNLSGGVLYSRVMEQVFPGFLAQAPIERRITRNYIQFLNKESAVGLDYSDRRLAEPVNAVTVLRAKLDAWLAEQCESVGVMLMTGVRVDNVLRDGDAVIGVRAGDDELQARVVVAADGVNSFLARGAGLRRADSPNHLAIGIKAVVELGAELVQERFHCGADDGAAYAVVGDCTKGVGGGGFLYTNRESVSIGVVLRLDDLTASGLAATEIFDHFLAHPFIAPLLEGGELIEYGSHLVAEGGLAMVGDLVADGLVVVGDAAGLTLNTGLTVRGMDLAAGSAIAAADAIDAALIAGDTSRAGLASYGRHLSESFVGQDLKTYARAPSFLENRRLYREYGQLLGDILYGVYNHDLRPRRHLIRVAGQAVKRSGVKLGVMLADGWNGGRAL